MRITACYVKHVQQDIERVKLEMVVLSVPQELAVMPVRMSVSIAHLPSHFRLQVRKPSVTVNEYVLMEGGWQLIVLETFSVQIVLLVATKLQPGTVVKSASQELIVIVKDLDFVRPVLHPVLYL